MRRWLIIVLLTLLPLQSSWAAAAAYCAHEQGVAGQHFGHHEHRHHGAAVKTADAAGADARNALAAGDLDCASCHLSSTQPLVGTVSVSVVAPREKWAPVLPPWRGGIVILAIERPNWSLAA